MTVREIATLENQSLYDLCIQHYGSYDGLLDLIQQNFGVITSVDQLLPAGTILNVGEAIDQDLVDYYIQFEIDVVGVTLEDIINNDSGIFTPEFSDEFA